MNIAYLNKKFLPLKKANISILDRGFLYGDGAFETMRSYGKVVFREKEHIERLVKTARSMGLAIRASYIRSKLKSLLKKGGIKNAYIKIIVTRGVKEGLLLATGKTKPTLVIYATALNKTPLKLKRKGISVRLSESAAGNKAKTAGKKSLNYLNNILALMEAKNKGFDDVILLGGKGDVVGASSSNIFMVKKKKLLTPTLESGCLPGITRKEVLCLAKKHLEIKTKECKIKRTALLGADEIFLTNSLKGVAPVARIDRKKIGRCLPGPVTAKISRLLKNAIENKTK